MKRRDRKIANFLAFNLLFFALYLNFIHKDKVATPEFGVQNKAAFSGTMLVENPSAYLNKKVQPAVSIAQPAKHEEENNVAEMKLSIN